MMPQDGKAKNMAIDHVDWFLAAIRPLLIDHFVHGHKHGRDDESADILTQVSETLNNTVKK